MLAVLSSRRRGIRPWPSRTSSEDSGSTRQGGATDAVIDPATGQEMARAASSDAADVDAAVQAAANAFVEWGATTPADRSAALLALADGLEAEADALGALESQNVGKPINTMGDEMAMAVDHIRYFAAGARNLDSRAAGEYLAGYTSMLRRDPLGVVASITPWNYPLMMAVWKIGPALAAGNTVVLKPSELTPLTSLRMAELAADVFPPGVLNVVTGQGETAGAALVEHPLVRMVSLTGDVATGKLIAANAAPSLTRVHLELGGKAPVLVFDDADLDAVIQAVTIGAYFNAGQDCTAACRVVAGPGLYDDLVTGLADAAGSIPVGDPSNESVDLGPVVSEGQRARVAGMVDTARDAGGRGGQRGRRPGPGRLVLRPDRRRRRGPGRRDRPARGLRPRRQRPALRGRGAGHRLGQRRGLRPGRQRLDP